jgi:hypothetical protein
MILNSLLHTKAVVPEIKRFIKILSLFLVPDFSVPATFIPPHRVLYTGPKPYLPRQIRNTAGEIFRFG